MKLLNALALGSIPFVCFLMAAFSASPAEAYIPNSHTIAGRLVRNSGKGVFVVDQEVQFKTAGDPVVLREHWVIENGETMRLTIGSPQSAKSLDPAHLEITYRDGKRFGVDPMTGAQKVSALAPEFIEGFFHSRSGPGFLNALHRARIVPPGALRERPHLAKLEQAKYAPEPYVRLGRSSGVVAWIFGDPTPSQSNHLNPSAWIEQDAFLVRRLRFPSEAEVSAERYTLYASAIKLPRERTVTWGENSAVIRVLSVKHLAQAPTREASTQKSSNLPDLAQVKEFYSRFR